MHETPNISAILEIFDPITVPSASSSVLLRTEEIPTNISGADVPSATIVKPIVNSLRPNFLQPMPSYQQFYPLPKLKQQLR